MITFIFASLEFIVAFGLNTKVSYDGFLGGVKSILQHLYLNVYAEFNSKISYNFLHDNQLACEIPTVIIITISNFRYRKVKYKFEYWEICFHYFIISFPVTCDSYTKYCNTFF